MFLIIFSMYVISYVFRILYLLFLNVTNMYSVIINFSENWGASHLFGRKSEGVGLVTLLLSKSQIWLASHGLASSAIRIFHSFTILINRLYIVYYRYLKILFCKFLYVYHIEGFNRIFIVYLF